ncbi:MAG: hypothetical protein Q9166_000055 [cf. Caloplaca sp. 2 TL-2023]
MNREAPFSSITAGPASATAASILGDDDPSAPTSTSLDTLTYTLRKTVSKPSTQPSIPPQNSTLGPQNTEATHRSNLGAGLGGGLGGATAAILIATAIAIYWKRKHRRAEKGENKYHEMESQDPTHRHNSMLFPAELTHEDSKASLKPAELSSITAKPVTGPYELHAEDKAIEKSSDDVKATPSDKTEVDNTSMASDLSDLKEAEAKLKRPLAQNRPDSTYSQSGPWHDSY